MTEGMRGSGPAVEREPGTAVCQVDPNHGLVIGTP